LCIGKQKIKKDYATNFEEINPDTVSITVVAFNKYEKIVVSLCLAGPIS